MAHRLRQGGLVALLVGVASTAAPARAQDDVDTALAEARRALENADPVVVDPALDRVAGMPMTREQLRTWLELRALNAYAEQRLGALEEALAAIASLDPERDPPESFPTPLRARLSELRDANTRVALDAQVTSADAPERDARTVGVVASVRADPGDLVRTTEVRARLSDGDWTLLAPDERIEVPGDRGREARVEYFIRAIGPGRVLVATLGSDTDPLVGVVPPVPSDDTPLVVGLTITGVAVAAGAVALVVAAVLTEGFRNPTSVVHAPEGAMIRF